jgi:hypothetical protein
MDVRFRSAVDGKTASPASGATLIFPSIDPTSPGGFLAFETAVHEGMARVGCSRRHIGCSTERYFPPLKSARGSRSCTAISYQSHSAATARATASGSLAITVSSVRAA